MKKNYSLALGGGAARGLVHIGILKYIEEKNIKINEISGTSMGAIIAGLFAIGKSIDEIIEFAKSINYFKLIDPSFKTGLLKGDKIYKKLHEVFGDEKIEDQKIKLKIIATNLIKGRKKVFIKGKIIDALRASFSLPGIFIPYEIDSNQYIDGGVTNNLPIDCLRGNNIIAVSALKNFNGPLKIKKKFLGFKINRLFLNINYQIIHRTILLMMKQNEIRSIELKNKDIILIEPNFGELEYYNFNKINEFVELGYNDMKKKFKNI